MLRKISLILGFALLFGLFATTSVFAQVPAGLAGQTVWVNPTNPPQGRIRVTSIWLQYDRIPEEWMITLWTGNDNVRVRGKTDTLRSDFNRNHVVIFFTYQNQHWYAIFYNGILEVRDGTGGASGTTRFRRQ